MTFQVGQKVRVTSVGVTNDPNGMGQGVQWVNSWQEDMTENVGKVFTVEFVATDGTGVHVEECVYGYPANVLEAV